MKVKRTNEHLRRYLSEMYLSDNLPNLMNDVDV